MAVDAVELWSGEPSDGSSNSTPAAPISTGNPLPVSVVGTVTTTGGGGGGSSAPTVYGPTSVNANNTGVTTTAAAEGISVQITGTFVGTISFQTSDDNVNWISQELVASAGATNAVTSTTTTGVYTGVLGGQYFRAIFTAYTSGTATITAVAYANAGDNPLLIPQTITFPSTAPTVYGPTSLSALNAAVTTAVGVAASVSVQLVPSSFNGTFVFEVSDDNVNWQAQELWTTGGAAAEPQNAAGPGGGIWAGNVGAQYFRVRVSSYTSGSITATVVAYANAGDNVAFFVPGGNTNNPAYERLQDGTTTNLASIAAYHNTDNQGTTTGNALLTGGVAQVLNQAGNLDRQRETGADGIAPIGIATGSAQFAMAFRGTIASAITLNASPQAVTPGAMSGNVQGVPWGIYVGSVITVDTGANAEVVLVTAITSTTFTAIFTKNHATTPIPFTSFVYNQERDASGELDGATGAGTAVAVGYEYNGGHPDGTHNYDRERNLHAKGHSTAATSAATTAGQTAITLATAPTGLEPGEIVTMSTSSTLLTGTIETAYVASNYVPGSVNLVLAAGLVNSGYTYVHYETYAPQGPGLNPVLPYGIGIEEDVVYNPSDGQYYIERAASADAMAAANIPAIHATVFNGTTHDRQRSINGYSFGYELSVATGTGVSVSINAATGLIAGTSLNLLTAHALLSMQVTVVTTTVGTSGTHTVQLQGSLDNVNWFTLATASPASTSTTSTDASNNVLVASTNTPVRYIRANWTAIPTSWVGNMSARVCAN